MTAVVLEVADAVVDELNDATWSIAFDAERVYVATAKLKDLGSDTVVYVVPRELDIERQTRGSKFRTVGVDIAVMAKVESTGVVDVDPHTELMSAIVEHFHERTLTGSGLRVCSAAKVDPIFDPADLDRQRVFFSVVRLEVRVHP